MTGTETAEKPAGEMAPLAARPVAGSFNRAANGGPLGLVMGASIVATAVAMQPEALDAFAAPTYGVAGVAAVVVAAILARGVWIGTSTLTFRAWPDIAVLAFVGFTVLAAITADAAVSVLHGERFQQQGLGAVLLYAVAFVGGRAAARSMALPLAAAVAGLVVSAYGIAQWFGVDPFFDSLVDDRIFSTFGQPNALGAYLALTLPFAAALTRSGHETWRRLGWVATPVIAVVLLLTFSRGAYVGVVVAGLAVLAVTVRRVPARTWARALLAALAVIGLLMVIPSTRTVLDDVSDRATSIAGPLDGSNSKRVDLWRVGVEMVAAEPILGVGPDGYATAFLEYAPAALDAEELERLAAYRPESPHNVYLGYATGAGLPAAVAYLAVVGWALATCVRGARRSPSPMILAALFALSAYAVTNLFMTAETAGGWLFWALLGSVAPVLSGSASPHKEVRHVRVRG